MSNRTFREFVVEMNANHGVLMEDVKPKPKKTTLEVLKTVRRKKAASQKA